MFIIVFLGMAISSYSQDGTWMVKSWDDINEYDAIGFGVCTYTDEVHNMKPAVYGQFSMFGYKDLIRLNFGVALPPYYLPDEEVIRITLAGGITTLFRDLIGDMDVEVGAYYGASASRRPYGIMVGLVF